jgi:hypothetical protein
MDYGQLIRDAWSTTWQHRFLWVLGLFTGAAVGTCSGAGNRWPSQMPSSTSQAATTWQAPPEIKAMATILGAWIVAHLALIVAAVILLVVVGLVVSVVAQGGMTEATVDLARHQPTSLGRAWQAGRRLFWRFLGLALVPLVLALIAAFVIAAGAALAFATSMLVGAGARVPVIGFWALLALTAILVLIALAIALSIALAYAQRIVVVDDVGVVAAVRAGWRVLRAHLGSSLLTWLINLGLTIGAELAVGVAMAVVLGILVAIGLAVYTLAGFTAVTGAYVALGAVVAIALFWGMEAIVHTFLWSYWTLAYLRLTALPPETAG